MRPSGTLVKLVRVQVSSVQEGGVAVGVDVGEAVAVGVAVPVGVGVGVGPGAATQYLPPLFKNSLKPLPPQTIIALPVHTAVCEYRPAGALVRLVSVQLSLSGLYLPPVFAQTPTIAVSAPYLHYAAGPDCRRLCPAIRRVGGAGRCPNSCAGIVSPAGFKAAVYAASVPAAAPDDHFAAGPHCRMPVP